ncbi:MAG: ATP-binding cassette domain-containing protein [Synergistaceae bacterium]|nr:ATP-binding cassette domain-containing protein [Synergistaceae bacterium]
MIWQGRTEDFWARAEELGFALPPLQRLAKRLVVAGFPVPSPCTVEGMVEAITRCVAPRPAGVNGEGLCPIILEEQPPFLEIRELSFRFDVGEGWALREVNASVPKGGWLSIVGRTGSGKSTLAQHLNGLYKIQSGSILIEGSPLPQKGPELHALRQRVGLVFQNPEAQFFSPTVEEELRFAPRNAGLDGKELELAVLTALDAVGLEQDFLGRNPLALSGGERRLVAIASVLAAAPECLVLDEPLAGLDAAYRKRILALLSNLRDEGRSIVAITHDLNMALGCCDSVLVMDSGRVVGQGTPRDILPALMDALKPEVWPDVLKLSARLRDKIPFVPLTWDWEELTFHL